MQQHIYEPPRLVAWSLRAVGAALGYLRRIDLRMRSWIAKGAAGFLVLVVATAYGAGTTIPERTDAICVAVGQPAGCTTWNTEPVRPVRGTLTIGIADNTVEPNASAAWAPIRTSVLSFAIKHGPTLQIPVQINEGSDATSFVWYLGQSPCLEAEPECRDARASGDPTYTGPTRANLADAAAVLDKLLFQVPDAQVSAALRAYAGASPASIPYVASVGKRTTFYNPTDLAATRTVDLVIRFATP